MNLLDDLDDEAIDRMWRARYGQPLPMMGSAAIARKILTEWMLEPAPAPRAESGASGGGARPTARADERHP